MNTVENFIVSKTSALPDAAFKERALEKTVAAYERSGKWSWQSVTKIVIGISVVAALTLLVFFKITKPAVAPKDKEMAKIESDTKVLETEISQDPVLSEAVRLPND